VRLDGCRMPATTRREIQYVDVFPDWERGLRWILTIIRRQLKRGPRKVRQLTF